MSEQQVLVAAGSLNIRLDSWRKCLIDYTFSVSGVHASPALMCVNNPTTVLTKVLAIWAVNLVAYRSLEHLLSSKQPQNSSFHVSSYCLLVDSKPLIWRLVVSIAPSFGLLLACSCKIPVSEDELVYVDYALEIDCCGSELLALVFRLISDLFDDIELNCTI
jgi:hypothetical protein